MAGRQCGSQARQLPFSPYAKNNTTSIFRDAVLLYGWGAARYGPETCNHERTARLVEELDWSIPEGAHRNPWNANLNCAQVAYIAAQIAGIKTVVCVVVIYI